ncbi:dynein light chain 4 [Salpingoeca rosetta]|uniref:Dynein light chain n=1 Tax=Salpingoeca rosetta (strain ATCC 50818 / BSB-021) TaxID=946362 RepID=F2U6N7_SALR5|nr:dynein light chain 4 [Salpingoeca rosetta]EGD83519.1 dynein light chain 4 [Salpingoeca rosetta]|eukprot:XP_004995023.1 dynein light chain 4 [Salpingoeca rosetta]
MGDDAGGSKPEEVDIRRNFNYALVVKTDMNEEMLAECTESAQTAIEKHSKSNEDAANMLKGIMDKKFGAPWNVIIGEAFGFEITHQTSNMMYMFFGGNLAVLVWKCQ